ncbi:ficolin-1-like [Saccostrea echinata]|uniref:ficolin-1-like n=1 Tax=Saccostrea echinata TaxID=191078 RepID=UPI002A8240A9|nr:ficolin-1-like [Saccostrea echinata]
MALFSRGVGAAEPLFCLSCSSVISPRHCHNIRKCEEGQVCYTEKFTNYNGETLYDVGCHTMSYCNLTNAGSSLLDITSNTQIKQCVECCDGNACNSHGCKSKDYPATRGPICFSCQQTTDPSLCRTIRVCNEDEVCHLHEIHEFGERFFSSMCLQRQICDAYNPGSLFGRKRFVHTCSMCCGTDLCNHNCGRLPIDCLDIYKNGQRITGVYKIYPSKDFNKPVQVKCNMDIQGGGWTTIQFRSRDNPPVDFKATWDEYKKGFGDVQGNYWLGNDLIHQLTTVYNSSLYITMKKTDGHVYHAQYSSFSISNETDGYRLSLGKFSGNVLHDEFRDHTVVDKEFYTFDHDNAAKCSAQCGSGWWYQSCTTTNLNAPFSGIHRDSVWYNTIHNGGELMRSSMLIKRLE